MDELEVTKVIQHPPSRYQIAKKLAAELQEDELEKAEYEKMKRQMPRSQPKKKAKTTGKTGDKASRTTVDRRKPPPSTAPPQTTPAPHKGVKFANNSALTTPLPSSATDEEEKEEEAEKADEEEKEEEEQTDEVEAPEEIRRTNSEYLHKVFVRYQFGVTMETKENPPMEQLVGCLKLVLTRLQQLEKTIHIAPWDDHEMTEKFITKPADIPKPSNPKAIWHLGTWFHGLRRNPKLQTKQIMAIRLAWNPATVKQLLPKEIGGIMAHSFPEPENTIEIFKNPIIVDAPSNMCLGWLLYSTHKIHSEDYTGALIRSLKLKDIVIDRSQIGFKWQAIAPPNGRRTKWDRADPPSPSALHLYVASDFEHLIRRAVGEIYATPKSQGIGKLYPQKVLVRLIPCYTNKITQILDPSLRAEISRATDYQLYFNTTHIRTIEFTGVNALDSPLSKQRAITLRDIIMSLAPKDNPRKRIFQSVDTDWKSHSKCHFTTVSKMHDHALDMVSMLIPYLRSTHGKKVDKWFTITACKRADGTVYNPTSQTVTSLEAASLRETLQSDVWEMSEDFAAHQNSHSASRPTEISGAATAMEAATVIAPHLDDQTLGTLKTFGPEVYGTQPGPQPVRLDDLEVVENQKDTRDQFKGSTMGKTTGKTRLELRQTKLALETATAKIDTAAAQHTKEIQKLKEAMARMQAGNYKESVADPMSGDEDGARTTKDTHKDDCSDRSVSQLGSTVGSDREDESDDAEDSDRNSDTTPEPQVPHRGRSKNNKGLPKRRRILYESDESDQEFRSEESGGSHSTDSHPSSKEEYYSSVETPPVGAWSPPPDQPPDQASTTTPPPQFEPNPVTAPSDDGKDS